MFETLFGSEMPLAARFFIAFLVVLALIGADRLAGAPFRRQSPGRRRARTPAAAGGDRCRHRRRAPPPGADPPRQCRASADDRRPDRPGGRAQHRARGWLARSHPRAGAGAGNHRTAVDGRLSLAAAAVERTGRAAAPPIARPPPRNLGLHRSRARVPAPPPTASPDLRPNCRRVSIRPITARRLRATNRHRAPAPLRRLRLSRPHRRRTITILRRWRSSSKQHCAAHRRRKAARR